MLIGAVTPSTTVAGISTLSRLAAATIHRALGDGVIDQGVDVGNGLLIDDRAEWRLALARIAGGERLAPWRRIVSANSSPTASTTMMSLGGHADLALVHEGAEGGGLHRLVEVGIFQHDQRRLATEFQQAGLQILRPRARRRCGRRRWSR